MAANQSACKNVTILMWVIPGSFILRREIAFLISTLLNCFLCPLKDFPADDRLMVIFVVILGLFSVIEVPTKLLVVKGFLH